MVFNTKQNGELWFHQQIKLQFPEGILFLIKMLESSLYIQFKSLDEFLVYFCRFLKIYATHIIPVI